MWQVWGMCRLPTIHCEGLRNHLKIVEELQEKAEMWVIMWVCGLFIFIFQQLDAGFFHESLPMSKNLPLSDAKKSQQPGDPDSTTRHRLHVSTRPVRYIQKLTWNPTRLSSGKIFHPRWVKCAEGPNPGGARFWTSYNSCETAKPTWLPSKCRVVDRWRHGNILQWNSVYEC